MMVTSFSATAVYCKKVYGTEFAWWAFSVMIPHTWNSVPLQVAVV